MAVPPGAASERAGVRDQMQIAARYDPQARIGEEGCRGRRAAFCSLKRGCADPPGGLLFEIGCGARPLGAAEEHGTSRQRSAPELRARSVGMKEAPAIVIAQERDFALWAQQGMQKLGHASHLFGDGLAGDRVVGQKHIERVHVIVRGLLKVAAVVLHLGF